MKNQNEKLYGELTGRLLSRYIANIDLNQNVVFSPLSVLILLGMLIDATDGQTRKEIAKIFGCEKKPAGIVRWLHDIQKELAKSGALKSSNAVCVKASLKDKIMPGYEKHIRKLFDGRLFASSDMTNDVNQWVCENTNGMIQQIADDSINDMLACLMNAIVFEARWEHEYEFIDIVPGDFHNADKSSNEVSMMRSTEMQYIEDAYFTGFTKPYKKVGYEVINELKDKTKLIIAKPEPEMIEKAGSRQYKDINEFLDALRHSHNEMIKALITEAEKSFTATEVT